MFVFSCIVDAYVNKLLTFTASHLNNESAWANSADDNRSGDY